ncbi:hypothetical protein GGR62_000789 [Xanthomonas campestris]|nr:hypothetical protein [Xanthomonas sp. 3075]
MPSATADLTDILLRHAPADGIHATPIAGLHVMRSAVATDSIPTVYTPMLCLVAQGRKRAMLGAQAYHYHPQMYLVASVDLPIVGSVIEASATHPYLCFCLDLDTAVLSELAIHHAELAEPQRDTASAGLLLNAARRSCTTLRCGWQACSTDRRRSPRWPRWSRANCSIA